MTQLQDKIRGCYFGAAIGDAMGGPVETMHYRKIERLYGRVDRLLEYRVPPGHIQPSPNVYYVAQSTPGTYTDDTRGRNLLAHHIIEKGRRITAEDFSEFLCDALNPEAWFPAVMVSYWNIKYGGADPRDAGFGNMPGGGVAWWSVLGIVNAADPETAYWDAFDASSFLKRGTDRELASAVAAAVAEAFRPGASVRSVVDAAIRFVGPVSRDRILAAVDLAAACEDAETFYRRAYETLLVPWKAEFQLTAYMPIEGGYSCDLEEQVPIAIACFVLAGGDARSSIIAAVNFGRDNDTIATTTGAIAGAFDGAANLPSEWIDAVRTANPDLSLERADMELDRIVAGLHDVVLAEVARAEARCDAVLGREEAHG